MSTWEIATDFPDFAEAVQTAFDAHKHKTLATIRRHGSPRISGIEATFADGELWLGMMPNSLKALDLLRDPRLALHTATVDTELGGQAIAAGDPLLLLYASADRDEAVFGTDAEEFRIDRSPNPHVALGFGPHFCIGAALARLEGRVLLEELLARWTRIEPAGDVARTGSAIIAGLKHAPVRLRR